MKKFIWIAVSFVVAVPVVFVIISVNTAKVSF